MIKFVIFALSLLAGLFILWHLLLPGLVVISLVPGIKFQPLNLIAEKPDIQTANLSVNDKAVAIDVYRTSSRTTPRGSLVIFHAANELGKDDERLIRAAKSFNQAGLAVFAPTLPDLNREKFHPEVMAQMSAVINFARNEYPDIPLAVFSFSIGVGPQLIVSSREDVAEQVDLLIAMGGYFDLANVIRFHTTKAYFTASGELITEQPLDPFGTWLFARYYAQFLSEPDSSLILEIADRKWEDLNADISDISTRLNIEGEAVLNLIQNQDPQEVENLILKLPSELRHFTTAFDVAPALSKIKSKIILLHSIYDQIIPAEESASLHAALLKHGVDSAYYPLEIFDHVSLILPEFNFKNLIQIFVPEFWKLYKTAYQIIYLK